MIRVGSDQDPRKKGRKITEDLLNLMEKMVSENEAWRIAFVQSMKKETISV